MTQNLDTLDKWRNFFETGNLDIYDIIDNAILVAAKYHPQEFRSKRDKIAEALYSCTYMKCIGCDHVESLGGPEKGCKRALEKENVVFGEKISGNISKVISGKVDEGIANEKKFDEYNAEALSDELEEEQKTIGEVLRIKQIIENKNEESEATLLDSLKRLQLMDLTMDNLHATQIRIQVGLLKKHRSNEISMISKTLIRSWKSMIKDQLCITTQSIAAADAKPVKSPILEEEEEEEGLPLPPLDDGCFFLNQPTYLELSNFFDGIDDNGNIRENGDLKKNLDVANNKYDTKNGPGGRVKVGVNKKTNNGRTVEHKPDKGLIQNHPIAFKQEKLKSVDLEAKLEATKRKLHEDYRQVQETKKKQRTIQLMDLCDIPKQGLDQSKPRIKPASGHSRPSRRR